jgi:uncharacterized protein (TIGR00297 family)
MTHFVTALLITLAFAVAGWAAGGVTPGGAVAGFVVAFALLLFLGWGAFATLLAVFVLTWIATRTGYARKQKLGVAERRRGRRNAGQVLANIGIAAACALAVKGRRDFIILSGTSLDIPFLARLCAVAALCEAGADTVSSECGEAWSDSAYLITSFARVPGGTNGAITLAGTAAAIAAALVTAAVAVAFRLLPNWRIGAVAAAGGFAGTFVDSLLGATLENRGLLNNNAVNLASTVSAAAIAIAIGFAL